MTFDQKVEALAAVIPGIPGLSVSYSNMTKQWYVSGAGLEYGGNGFLGGFGGHCDTPQEAIEEFWECATNPPDGLHIAIGGWSDKRRDVRWNGFMWKDIE